MSRADILAADAKTGTAKVLLTEQSKTFLTNQHEAVWGTDTGFWLLPDGSGFIWRSERDGWDHLYRYDMSGAQVARLTQGAFPVRNEVRIDQKNGWVYYYAHGDQTRPYDTHLYRVSLTGTGAQQLTEGPGQHEVSLSPSAEWFVDTYSNVGAPPKTVLRRADGKLVLTLGEADISRLRKLGWVPPREYVIKAADGKTDLWATMYFPFDFGSTKTYPVVEYIYGGPQTTARPMDFGAAPGPFARLGNFNRALANLGFLVVTLDGLTALQPDPRQSRGPLEIVANSLSWSLLGVLIWWLEHDLPHPPEYMAEQFQLLIGLDLRQVLGLEPLQT